MFNHLKMPAATEKAIVKAPNKYRISLIFEDFGHISWQTLYTGAHMNARTKIDKLWLTPPLSRLQLKKNISGYAIYCSLASAGLRF